MDADLLHGFYLGDLFVEPLKGQVSDRTESRHLPPKAAEVLMCLAREPGELVSHDTLLECAWGEDQGSHEALSHAVSDIRTALDDHADDPVYIQTLPRVGYRLAVTPELPGVDDTSVVLGAQSGARVEDIGLFENLQRRGVIETALAYMILGWLLIQIADVVFGQLHLPNWAGTFVTVLVILGFPIALVLSWFLELHDGHPTIDALSPAQHRRRRFSRTYLSVVCSLAIAGIMVAIYDQVFGLPSDTEPTVMIERHTPQLPPVVENSLAVLPFVNLDGTQETQLLADGLVDDVIDQLSRVPGLRVASRGDAYSLEANSPSHAVRNRLRVALYIEGSVAMNADEIRVTVQLIDSGDGFHRLSRRFDRPREQFFALRDDITSLIVSNVRVSLPPELQSPSSQLNEPLSLTAYALYRQGVQALRRPVTIDTIATAIGWFDAALYLDPEYAVAHAGKCDAYVKGYRERDEGSYIEKARSSCAAAIALHPSLDVVNASLGDLHMATGRFADAEAAYLTALDYDSADYRALKGLSIAYQRLNRPLEAEAVILRAIDTHPGAAGLYNSLGAMLFEEGRIPEAIKHFGYAVALAPDDMKYASNLGSAYMAHGEFGLATQFFKQSIEIRPTQMAHSNLGLLYYFSGDYEAAIKNQRAAVELQPNDHLARANLGDMLLAAGKTREARQAFTEADEMGSRALRVNPNDPYIVIDLAWIKTLLEDYDDARRLIDRALEMVPDDYYAHYYNGLIHNRTGNVSQALVALKRAVDNGYSPYLLARDPNLANLKGDSRFRSITESPTEERK